MKKFSKLDLLYIFIGILIGAISILLYFKLSNSIINIIMSFISGIYSIFYMYYVLIKKKIFNGKEKYIFPILFLIVLYICILIVLIMTNPIGDFGLDYYLWSIYVEVITIPVLYFGLVYFSNEEYRYDRR